MKRRGGPSDRLERKQTAAVEQITGQFYCSSSAHWTTGKPGMVGKRKICKACADKRASILKGKAHV